MSETFEETMTRERVYSMRNIGMGGQANDGLAAYMTEEQRKRRTAKLDETRQLKRPGAYYLTDLEGSNCETLEDWDFNLMPFKWRNVDLDRFKKECEEIDREGLADQILALDDWIRVEDGLPDKYQKVLVALPTGAVFIGMMENVDYWLNEREQEIAIPTHWQPLKAPK